MSVENTIKNVVSHKKRLLSYGIYLTSLRFKTPLQTGVKPECISSTDLADEFA